jgi:hypothetical protein
MAFGVDMNEAVARSEPQFRILNCVSACSLLAIGAVYFSQPIPISGRPVDAVPTANVCGPAKA